MTGILLVDKEEGWTSSDVVAKLRGILHERRIGHAGTLDPLATGLLVVMVGQAAKASDYLMHHYKHYTAHLRLGITTDTQDITGKILSEVECSVTPEKLQSVLPSFLGESEQIPPMYSAIKIGGQKLYDIARRGGEVERKPRKIDIPFLSLTGMDGEDHILDIDCSAGTYIRTLCHDIGQQLGCGGVMTALRRTVSGEFRVEDAHTVSQIAEAVKTGRTDSLLIPVDRAFSEYPAIHVSEEYSERICHGNPVENNAADGLYRVYSASRFLMLGRQDHGILKIEKAFYGVDQ